MYSKITNPALRRLSYTLMHTVRGTQHVECGQQRAVRHRKTLFCFCLHRPDPLWGLHGSVFGACRKALSAESKGPSSETDTFDSCRGLECVYLCLQCHVQYSTVQYSTVQYRTAQHSTAQYILTAFCLISPLKPSGQYMCHQV